MKRFWQFFWIAQFATIFIHVFVIRGTDWMILKTEHFLYLALLAMQLTVVLFVVKALKQKERRDVIEI